MSVSTFFSVAVFVSSQNRVYNAFQWWSIIQREYERRKINKFYLFSGFDIHYSWNLIRLQQSAASFIIQSHFSWSIIKYQLNLYGLTHVYCLFRIYRCCQNCWVRRNEKKTMRTMIHNSLSLSLWAIIIMSAVIDGPSMKYRADLCSIFFRWFCLFLASI